MNFKDLDDFKKIENSNEIFFGNQEHEIKF